MYNKLKFYFTYTHVNDLNLAFFKKEITSPFKNNDPLYNYDFQLNYVYYIHLFLPSGKIIGKLPFKLLSLEDKEDVIEDIYIHLYPFIDKYLKSVQYGDLYMNLAPYKPIFLLELFYLSHYFKFTEFPSYIGLYISLQEEYNINTKDLTSNRDLYKK
jgi:hypothetical protein